MATSKDDTDYNSFLITSPVSPPQNRMASTSTSSLQENVSSDLIRTHNEDTEESKNPKDLQRIRKESHRAVERRRRVAINEGIKDLDNMLPTDHSPLASSKGNVIKRACLYVRQLIEENKLLKQEVALYRLYYTGTVNQSIINQAPARTPQIEES